MNEQQQKQIAIKVGLLFVVLLVGILIGTKITKDPQAIVTTVEVEKNGDTWRELKAIDDEGFKLASKQLELCTGAMYAASNGDLGTLTAIDAEIKKDAGKSSEISKARQNALKILGY